MKILVPLLVLATAASAALQGYNLPSHSGPSFNLGNGPSTDHIGGGGGGCSNGQVRHVDGRCVTPRENRRVFLYEVPSNVLFNGASVDIPEPTIETNILLVRTSDGSLSGPDPVVIPPPQQRHVVYVLNKQSEHDQRVIEVPAPPLSNPEVYFVNYAEGENPTLPSGVDLESAINTASQGGGQIIGDAGSGGGVSGGGSVGGAAAGVSSGGSGGLVVGGGFGANGAFGGSNVFGGGFGGGSVSGSLGGGFNPPTQPSNLYTSP